MQIIERLNQVIAEYDLLQHPFYQAWSEGRLNMDDLRYYAAQYGAQVESFPRFLSQTHANCPDITVRKELLKNLVDEEIHGTDHPTLWWEFEEGLGGDRAHWARQPHTPETEQMVETYYELARRDWRDGLCALYAYESQVPAVSESKIAGLKKFYNINDEKTLGFFTAHLAYDVEHSHQVATLIEKHVDAERAEKATREAAKVLWAFLDGICRERNICMTCAA